MAGKKVTTDLTEDQALDCAKKLAVAKAEVRKLELMLKHYVAENGGFSHAGLHFYNTQAMRETYDPQVIGEALEELGIKFTDVTRLFPVALVNKLVRASDYGADIRAILKNIPNEGMVIVYGKPTIGARTNAPDESKVHILQPGEKSLETAPLEKVEDDEEGEDTSEYEEAPLSPGD
jgi:hypothetical protein